MECSIGRKLAGAFSVAARQYADTVAKLGRLNTEKLDMAQILKAEQEILHQAAEALRKAESARMAFESHIHQHRCKASVA